MKVAICIFKYFPFGGLQQKMLRIANACLEGGHSVDVFTESWQGDHISHINVHEVKLTAFFNHSRAKQFSEKVQSYLFEFDLVIGVNKIEGLDIYYSGDVCFKAYAKRNRSFFYPLTSRYRKYCALEETVFSPESGTTILALTEQQVHDYQKCYRTPIDRFYFLEPGLQRNEMSEVETSLVRQRVRRKLAVPDDRLVLLFIASSFNTKGLDRVLNALAQTKDLHLTLWVFGGDDQKKYKRLVKSLDLVDRVKFFGPRRVVPDYMLAADVLLNPARVEASGTAIVEALTCGLPVILTDNCGYAFHVRKANAGIIIPSRFELADLITAIYDALSREQREIWHRNALLYTATAGLYNLKGTVLKVVSSFSRRQIYRDYKANDEVRSLFVEPNFRRSLSVEKDLFQYFMNIQDVVCKSKANRRLVRLNLNHKSYFIKQHFGVGWKEIFKSLALLRLPILGAKPEWRANRLLRKLGIPALNVLAFAEGKELDPAKRRSFILSEELTGCRSLEVLWTHGGLAGAQRITLTRHLAEVSRRLHQSGVSHGGYYFCNLWWHEASGKLYVMSLQRAQINPKVSRRALVKDLADLYFSSLGCDLFWRDIFRFLKIYFNLSLRKILSRKKSLLQAVEKRAARLYRREHDKAAPLLK